jgi:hypothetical protein
LSFRGIEEGRGEDLFRHQCLVRWVIKLRTKDRDAAHKFLNGHFDEKQRFIDGWNKKHPHSKLDRDVRDQWAKGNRGEYGDWR